MDTVSSETAVATRRGPTSAYSAVRRAGKSSAQSTPKSTARATIGQKRPRPLPKSAARARPVTTPRAWVKTSTRPRCMRSATRPVNGPTSIIGAERANAATATMNGESVSWKASQPSRTRSIQRTALTQRPESQSRR
jgi:hypothetical protein